MSLTNTLLGLAGLVVLVVLIPFTRNRIASLLTGWTGTWVGSVRIERRS
jgi:hypothetical protein